MRARFQLPIGAIVHPLADPQDLPIIGLDAGGDRALPPLPHLHQPLRHLVGQRQVGCRVPISVSFR